MELLQYAPETVRGRTLPWAPFNVMALGDIQYGSEACDVERLRRHIAWGMRHDAYFMGMGDYTDFLSPSNRQRLKQAALYDTAQELIDQWHLRHLDELKEVLAPTRGRWIGVHEGHHYHEFTDGTTSDTRLAAWLGAPFLGTSSITRLNFKDEANHRSVVAHVWAHHGEGSGAVLAAPFNKMQAIAGSIDADVYLMGHFHRSGVVLSDKLYVGGTTQLRLRHRTRALVATGSFLRSYLQGSRANGRPRGSYVEQGLMTPTALGNTMVTIEPHHGDNYDYFDLTLTTVSV